MGLEIGPFRLTEVRQVSSEDKMKVELIQKWWDDIDSVRMEGAFEAMASDENWDAHHDTECEDLNEQVGNLEKENKMLERTVNDLEREVSGLEDEVDKLVGEMSKLSE